MAVADPARCLVVGRLPEPDLVLAAQMVGRDRVKFIVAGPETNMHRLGRVDVILRLFPGRLGGLPEDPFREALAAHPEVRWVHSVSAGIDDLEPLFDQFDQAVLTHSAGVTAGPISEFVIACLLHHVKAFPELDRLRQQHFFQEVRMRELADLRVAVMGMGRIGQEVTRRLYQFGTRVVAVRRHPQLPSGSGVEEVFGAERLEEAVTGADALLIAAPRTPETRGRVTAGVLAKLAEGSVLINVARGAIVDEPGLLVAMAEGRPAAAYLDAFAQEPLPASSPLWRAPGVYVSPHVSWSSEHFARRTSRFFAEQMVRWLAGEPLLNRVDPALGY